MPHEQQETLDVCEPVASPAPWPNANARLLGLGAGFPVSALPDADQAVRQRAGLCVVVAAGEMPELQPADFADVPLSGIDDRPLVCGLLPRIWDFAGHD